MLTLNNDTMLYIFRVIWLEEKRKDAGDEKSKYTVKSGRVMLNLLIMPKLLKYWSEIMSIFSRKFAKNVVIHQ